MDNFWISRIMKLFYKKSVLPTAYYLLYWAVRHSGTLAPSLCISGCRVRARSALHLYRRFTVNIKPHSGYFISITLLVWWVVTTGQPRPDTGRKVNVINLQSGSPPGSVSQSSDPDTSPWLLCVCYHGSCSNTPCGSVFVFCFVIYSWFWLSSGWWAAYQQQSSNKSDYIYYIYILYNIFNHTQEKYPYISWKKVLG